MELTAGGEFRFIQRLRKRLSGPEGRIRLGLGDDAAVIRPVPDHELVMTIDTLVESVHFDLSYTPPEALGWKSLAVNLSDIAAMGGMPVCALISLAVPEAWLSERIHRFYDGLQDCSSTYNCPVAGGDTVRTPDKAVITVTVLGEVPENGAVTRSGAGPGDILCITGMLGGSRAGLEALMSGRHHPDWEKAVARFLHPVPRIAEAAILSATGGVTAMIDVSDGLASEIRHLCRESGTGCRVEAERIPVAPSARSWAAAEGLDPAGFALGSGEEYELLFTMKPEIYNQLQREGTMQELFVKIGNMSGPESGLRLASGGRETGMPDFGWDHFKP